MTYDLFAFDRRLLEGGQTAQEVYELALDGLLPDHASAEVDQFVEDVLGHFPVLDERRTASFRALLKPQFEFEHGPGWAWFGLPGRSDLQWLVPRLAADHDLAMFDPQTSELNLPSDVPFDLPTWPQTDEFRDIR